MSHSFPSPAVAPSAPFVRQHVSHSLPQDLLDFADCATERFLHEDPVVVSEFAVGVGIPVLMTSASLPLDARQEVLRGHLKRLLGVQLGKPNLSAWLASLPADRQSAVREARVSIHEVDGQAAAWLETEERELAAVKMESKENLWNVLRGLLKDTDSIFAGHPLPHWIVIREDGQFRFYHRRSEAVAWSREFEGRALIIQSGEMKIQSASEDQIKRRRAAARANAAKADSPSPNSPPSGVLV